MSVTKLINAILTDVVKGNLRSLIANREEELVQNHTKESWKKLVIFLIGLEKIFSYYIIIKFFKLVT